MFVIKFLVMLLLINRYHFYKTRIRLYSLTNKYNGDCNVSNNNGNYEDKSTRKDCNKCPNCFLVKQLCICNKIKGYFDNNNHNNNNNNRNSDKVVLSHCKFILFTDSREIGRGSNTGKILTIGLPEITTQYIYHNNTYHINNYNSTSNNNNSITDQLLQDIGTTPTLLLYPSEDAEPIENYSHYYHSQQQINLLIIDSTWQNSKKMVKLLFKNNSNNSTTNSGNNIIKVKLNQNIISKYLNRKQSVHKNKMSTIESVIYSLILLNNNNNSSIITNLIKSLELSVDAVLTQQGKKTVYGNNFVPNISSNNHSEDEKNSFSPPVIKKPISCPHCNATSNNTIFKNNGIRKYNTSNNTGNTVNNIIDSTRLLEGSPHRVWKCQNCKQFFTTVL